MPDPKKQPDTDDRDSDTILIDTLATAIRKRGIAGSIQNDLAGFYASQGLQGAALESMIERGSNHLQMYRTMVQGRLRRVIREFIPRTVARLGKQRYAIDFADFFAQAGSHSVILRDVPGEFISFCRQRWLDNPEIADYLVDLATHEFLSSVVRNAMGGREAPTGQALALDKPLLFDGSSRLRRYNYAVHLLPRNIDDRSEPEALPCSVLAYRDRDNYRVRYISLTGRATEVIERLLAGATVLTALQEGAAAASEDLDDDFLAGMTQVFADLSERNVILGAPVEAPAT
ncbi:MAG TPA: hypothetical protein ENJ18_10705 [Nannocystis exedens]|nr:hypothetical protein [Nannocystis exedens]